MELLFHSRRVVFLTLLFISLAFPHDNLVSDLAGSNRNPKFLSFIRKLYQTFSSLSYTTSDSEFNQKYGEASNPNQYFAKSDPYNQNQLLNAVGVGSYRPITLSEPVVASETSGSGINSMNTLFTKLIGDDISTSSVISNILSLGTGSMENILKRINEFDSLKCIPRLLCQTIAQRQLDSSGSAVKTNSTIKPKSSMELRDGKTIKFQGVETALEQFIAFLDVVQLKNWSLYPYLKGAYEGSRVKRWDECAKRFQTCPFSDEQLVYYFNNYNGGFFQSLRSN